MENKIIDIPNGWIIDKEKSTEKRIVLCRNKVVIEKSIIVNGVCVTYEGRCFHILDNDDLKTTYDSAVKLVRLYNKLATLPSIAQYKIIFNNLTEINSFLEHKIVRTHNYWTCNVFDNTLKYCSNTELYNKEHPFYVRGIVNI